MAFLAPPSKIHTIFPSRQHVLRVFQTMLLHTFKKYVTAIECYRFSFVLIWFVALVADIYSFLFSPLDESCIRRRRQNSRLPWFLFFSIFLSTCCCCVVRYLLIFCHCIVLSHVDCAQTSANLSAMPLCNGLRFQHFLEPRWKEYEFFLILLRPSDEVRYKNRCMPLDSGS